MTSGESSKVIASAFGLAAFAVAMVAGVSAGNPADQVIRTGLLAMGGCYIAGSVIGWIGQNVVNEHLNALRDAVSGGPGAPQNSGATNGSVETTSQRLA